MPTNCSSCFGEIDCPADEMFPYSLTGTGPYGFVINCPEGSNCNNAQSVSMTCCGQTVTADISPSLSAAERVARVQRLVAQCHLLNSGCSDPAADGSDASTITNFYYSHRQNVSRECTRRSGTYHYSVLPGSAIASSQALADAQAAEIGEAFMDSHAFCLNVPVLFGCADAATTLNMSTVGGDGPFTVSVTSGSLPAGMTLTVVGGVIRMSGTPTTPGLYELEIQIDDAVGGYLLVDLEVTILEVTTTSLPDFTVGVPYSQQLSGSGGSGNYTWSITAGSLPAGLTMSTGGLISGTPTAGSDASFTVRMSDSEIGTVYGCSKDLEINNAFQSFYYALDEVTGGIAVDSYGANNTDMNDGARTAVSGKIAGAWLFDAQIPGGTHPSSILSDKTKIPSKSITVRFWVQYVETSLLPSITHDFVLATRYFKFEIQGGALDGAWNDNFGSLCFANPYSVDDGNWHRIIFSYDATTGEARFYVDDNPATVETVNEALISETNPIGNTLAPGVVAFQISPYVDLAGGYPPPYNLAGDYAFVNLDEIYIAPGVVWGDSEATYDWNGGAGRTYPDLP